MSIDRRAREFAQDTRSAATVFEGGNHRFWALAGTIAAFSAGACGARETSPPATPAAERSEPAELPASVQQSADVPDRTTLNISEDIRRACGISDVEAYFAYDCASVRSEYRSILRKLSECFTTGPLAGHLMRLVGHADPRGDQDYNLLLGGQRSANVKTVIVSEGMDAARIETSSRGEMDATGTDERSWAYDRRVDVGLGS